MSLPSSPLQEHPQSVPVTKYAESMLPIRDVQVIFTMSRPTFYRFRRDHNVKNAIGRRIHVGDIIRAWEAERLGVGASSLVRRVSSRAEAIEYAGKLLTIQQVTAQFKVSEATYWRLRLRQNVALLSESRVHFDDLVAALERDRSGLLP